MEKENRPEKTKSKQIWDRNACLFGASIFLKFIIFDCIWCSYTTFVPFSTIESYATKFIATLLLLSPYILFRRRALQAIILVLLDLLLIANLMYYRTYFTPIPASSYFLAGNLADFTGSVFDSLHLVDILLPLSSLVAIALSLKWGKTQRPKFACLSRPYLLPLLASILLFGITTSFKGGFKQAFNTMKQSPYLCSSGAPIYTVFGCICHDLLSVPSQLTPELRNQIRQWLDERPSCHKLPVTMEKRDNCILILAESLESWVLETKVEGQEITPCLNRLLKDSATLYAPHVLTQVRAGRSIDAQLMINTGLLPLVNGCYSSMYAEHTYPPCPKRCTRTSTHIIIYLP